MSNGVFGYRTIDSGADLRRQVPVRLMQAPPGRVGLCPARALGELAAERGDQLPSGLNGHRQRRMVLQRPPRWIRGSADADTGSCVGSERESVVDHDSRGPPLSTIGSGAVMRIATLDAALTRNGPGSVRRRPSRSRSRLGCPAIETVAT